MRERQLNHLHLVFGGPVSDPQNLDFKSAQEIDLVGVFPDYHSARKAWESSSRRTIDDAEMKYVIVDLRRALSTLPNQCEGN